MNGILLVDKPRDFTSFDVVAVIRKLTNQKKIGHTGTLDPMATGVLPILLGTATKAQSILPETDKKYLASFQLGITTNTQDICGEIIDKKEFCVSREQLSEAIKKFCGKISQIPPMFSAVKKNGVRLYALARKGIEVEREPRTVEIKKIELIDFNQNTGIAQISALCSKGTYIRTLCNDIGTSLGCGATMTSLQRTFACGFFINQTLSLENIKNLALNHNIQDFLIPTEKLFSCYPSINISKLQSIRFLNGGSLSLDRINLDNSQKNGQKFRIYSKDAEFLGIGTIDLESQQLKIFKLFKNGG